MHHPHNTLQAGRRRTLRASALAVVLGLVALLGISAPAVADGTGHSLNIYHQPNDSGQALLVCKDWSGDSNVRTSCPSKFATLPQGDGTRRDLGWNDTDGARVPAGYSLRYSQLGPDGIIYQNCTGGTRWRKVSPWIYTPSDTLKLYLKRNATGIGGC